MMMTFLAESHISSEPSLLLDQARVSWWSLAQDLTKFRGGCIIVIDYACIIKRPLVLLVL